MRPQRLRLGMLRQSIKVQRPVTVRDDAGQAIVQWQEWLPQEPTKVTTTGGVEAMYGQQLEAGTQVIFTVRYRDGWNTKARILYRGDEYGVTHLNELSGGRRYIEVFAARSDAPKPQEVY
jgi:SPP1 family predicted phage head-tail adaptor